MLHGAEQQKIDLSMRQWGAKDDEFSRVYSLPFSTWLPLPSLTLALYCADDRPNNIWWHMHQCRLTDDRGNAVHRWLGKTEINQSVVVDDDDPSRSLVCCWVTYHQTFWKTKTIIHPTVNDEVKEILLCQKSRRKVKKRFLSYFSPDFHFLFIYLRCEFTFLYCYHLELGNSTTNYVYKTNCTAFGTRRIFSAFNSVACWNDSFIFFFEEKTND